MAKAQNVQVYLGANVVELEPNDESTRIVAVHLRTLGGTTGLVRARQVVLACGGIENARLLLLSNRRQSFGLGNRSALVGRFFMQHPHATVAHLVATNEDALVNFVPMHRNATARSGAGIAVSKMRQEELGILNGWVQVLADADKEGGFASFLEIWRAVRASSWPEDMPEKLRDVVLDINDVAGGIYYRLRDQIYPGEYRLQGARLRIQAEQAPNPDSRVTLAASRDALGLRRAQVDWKLTELDRKTALRVAQLVAEEFGRHGFGRVGLEAWLQRDDGLWAEDLWGGCHHIGTTRMADDPDRGVVNRNCRMHSIDNLYIAGSSAFPTTGWANPTLTIVALALRLAEHLKQRSTAG